MSSSLFHRHKALAEILLGRMRITSAAGSKTEMVERESSEERGNPVIYKRGKLYWFEFWYKGERIRRPTKQGNPNVARQIEGAYRKSLANGEVGI